MLLKLVLIVLKLVDIEITFKENTIGLIVTLGDRLIIDKSWKLGEESKDSRIFRRIYASPKGVL